MVFIQLDGAVSPLTSFFLSFFESAAGEKRGSWHEDACLTLQTQICRSSLSAFCILYSKKKAPN